MALNKLGHVVLRVRDLDRSEAFYTGVLGLWKVGPDAAPAPSKQVGLLPVAWQVEREEDLQAFHDSTWPGGFRCD
jgi:catechol 2,3-dioxygenase-like lactoylglutathione lyase family enzyme